MLFMKNLKYIAATLLVTSQTTLAFDANSRDNVVLYWGQSSAGSQERLSYYCENDAADIMVLSFIYEFPGTNNVPGLDFSSACSATFSDGLLKCDDIAADILTCQSKGKKVLLSLGGAAGSYGFSSDSEAETFALSLWNHFGNGESEERPFGTSVIDGFDFDIENNSPTGYAALVNKLRQYFDKDTSKEYYISAAPQCVYPDASVGDLLANAQVDFAFVQFYNNYCNVDKTFNWDTWADFAANTSPNKNIKLFLGLPASTSAAGSGYLDVDTVKNAVTNTIGSNANFGGIMLWDASQLWGNQVNGQNYAEAMKSILTADGVSAATSTTLSSSSSSSSSSSTSTVSPTTTSSTQITSTPEPTTISTSSTSSSSSSSSSSVAPESSSSSTSTGTIVPTTMSTSSSSTAAEETTSSDSFSSTDTPVTTSTTAPTGEDSASSTEATIVTPDAITSTEAIANTPDVTTSTEATAVTQEATTPAEVTVVTQDSTTSTEIAVITTGLTLNTLVTSFTSATDLPTSSDATAAAASPTSASSGFTDCLALIGSEKAKCMNHNFAAGLFLGSSTSCNSGDYACTADGLLAQCNFGEWVTFQCAAGTTCYAYSSTDYVSIGCNFSGEESQYTKRQEGISDHKHHFH